MVISPFTEHYWKPILCRGLLGVPRARSWALGKGSICRGPAPGALGKDRPSAKRPLPSGKETALGKINLCRGPSPRQIDSRQIWPDGSRRPLASVFAECPPSGTRQRFFILFFKIFFAEGHWPSPRQRSPLPRARLGPRQRFFFF